MLRFIFILICCIPFMLQAQNLEQNLDKYWQYRDKLVNEYMIVGDSQGYSLPASYINPGLERMKWSDNTIWLGWYLGTLATEYHLLQNEYYSDFADDSTGIRIQQNRTELYYALKALIRLDVTAESSFTWNIACGIPNQRNGFFIRDDVPASITDSFPGYNFVDADGLEINYANEMSQDQVYHVLLGLSLIKKFIPDTMVINGMAIKDEAVNEASLIGAWVHQDGWIIKNPACGNKDVDRGPDVTLLAKGLNTALIYISDGAQDFSSDVNGTADFIWSTLNNPAVFLNVDNLHMTLALAAMGEGWGNSTLNNMMTIAESNRWYAYTLAYVALRDTTVNNYQNHKPTMILWADSMLNEAPIGGPISTYPDVNTHGYSVNNRFIRPRVNHYGGVNAGEVGHQWNGLDFMLLHNLRLIVDPAVWKTDADTINAVATVPTVNFNLYPNPATDQVMVILDAKTTGQTITLYNALGQQINSWQLTDSRLTIDVAEFNAGIYYIRVGAVVKKLVVQ